MVNLLNFIEKEIEFESQGYLISLINFQLMNLKKEIKKFCFTNKMVVIEKIKYKEKTTKAIYIKCIREEPLSTRCPNIGAENKIKNLESVATLTCVEYPREGLPNNVPITRK